MTDRSEAGLFRFDGFDLDASSGDLRMGETRLALQPQPFKVLALLVVRASEVVTREEIRRQLWSTGTFVDFEGSLNFCIRQIRKALGDDARKPRYIETLHQLDWLDHVGTALTSHPVQNHGNWWHASPAALGPVCSQVPATGPRLNL
jgi:hypothetical protein